MQTRRGQLRAVVATVAVVAGLAGPGATLPAQADANEAPSSAGARTLTAGYDHTCTILSTKLHCWGSNQWGGLGLGDTNGRGDDPGEVGFQIPAVSLGAGRTAAAVSAGVGFTCAVLDNGQVKCWGHNDHGQLGLGDTNDRGDGLNEMGDNLPAVQLGTGRTATAVSASGLHACAILDNGQVKCWGYNHDGQLGLGNTADRGDGLNEMGDNLPAVQLGTGRTATAITANLHHTCARLDNGQVKCWGLGDNGRLGQGDTVTRGDGANEMGDNLPAVQLGTGRTATAISAGDDFTCARLDNAQVKCWGGNVQGQLGRGDTASRGDGANEMGDNLLAVDLGTGRTATAISAGGAHVCVLLDNAQVKCWGANDTGTLGLRDTNARGDAPNETGDNLPAVDLGAGRSATAVTTGGSHTCARLDTGRLKCWGAGAAGQLGQGSTQARGTTLDDMGDSLPAVPLPPLGRASGQVRDAVTNAGIPFATIAVLRTADFSLVTTTFTDATGTYSIDLAPGTYFFYLLDYSADHRDGFAGAPTTVTSTDGILVAFNPTMPPNRGGFSGTLTDQRTGQPISSAVVFAIGTSGIAGVGVTDATGSYSVSGLLTGTYHAVFLDSVGGRPARYFPSSPDYAGSSAFTVLPGATTQNINGTLPPPPP